VAKIDHGDYRRTMNSRITNALPRLAKCFIISVAVSIGCSASKSAGTPAQLPANQALSAPSSTPLSTPSVHERTACTLVLSEAPAINRLKLGMTPDEILAVFPGSKDDAELRSTLSKPRGPLGNSSFLITPSKYGSAADFKEVSRVDFSLLDGRVSSFTVNYNGPQWPEVDKFVEKFVEGKSLPAADQWEPYAGMENQMKTLTCTGFSVRVFSGGEGGNLNYVLVQDLEADKKLKERRRKARESASPSPAP
jgi:hypothetical protein